MCESAGFVCELRECCGHDSIGEWGKWREEGVEGGREGGKEGGRGEGYLEDTEEGRRQGTERTEGRREVRRRGVGEGRIKKRGLCSENVRRSRKGRMDGGETKGDERREFRKWCM